MQYLALVADYDGTLATSGRLSAEVEGALERLRSSGRRAVLLTGRTFEELSSECPSMELFDSVALENGGVLYSPSRRQTTVLCHPPHRSWSRTSRGVGSRNLGPKSCLLPGPGQQDEPQGAALHAWLDQLLAQNRLIGRVHQ